MTTFGEDTSPHEVTYASIAAQVKSMAPRALTTNTLDDVITLIEFMRDEALRRHNHNELRSGELDAREKSLDKRARDISLHERAINAMLRKNAPRKLGRIWG